MIRKFSAGGVVYKREKNEILWLIRRSSPNPDYDGPIGWNFPRGLIDGKESSVDAANREVQEEGGVKAKIIAKLDPIKIFFTDRQTHEKVFKTITFFLMAWEKDLPEGFSWETAETKWVDLDKAIKLLQFKNEQEVLKKAAELLKSQ